MASKSKDKPPPASCDGHEINGVPLDFKTPRAHVEVVDGLLEFIPDWIKITEDVRQFSDEERHHDDAHEHHERVEDRFLHVRREVSFPGHRTNGPNNRRRVLGPGALAPPSVRV